MRPLTERKNYSLFKYLKYFIFFSTVFLVPLLPLYGRSFLLLAPFLSCSPDVGLEPTTTRLKGVRSTD